MALNLNHQTLAQFAARLRERYRTSGKVETARIAKWVLDHIEAGDFTDTQVRNTFGLTVGQYTTLKAKWTDMRTAYNAMLAAQGE